MNKTFGSKWSLFPFPAIATLILLLDCVQVLGQTASPIHVDASVFEPPAATSYQPGTSRSPAGHTIGLNSRYLLLDGKPWLPVMGEFHYTRVPEDEWEQQILKMKSAGISIISTYVIWNHHEEIEGQFDWSGSRNLREFAKLCAKHGMYLYVRIGPWAHGEARNGGFPDWLLQKARQTRRNDPVYLSYVKRFYDQIAQQLMGLLWKDGGPVIGVQLENEYAMTGKGAGVQHILELKRLATGGGLDVPLYSVTGWNNAAVPAGKTIAVFGGYPAAPWQDSLVPLPPQEVYVFRFRSRVTGNMGAIGGTQAAKGAAESYDFPFITAEMGGGIQDTYHRRPVIAPDDVAAMIPVLLGSGVNLYGFYMFQGGENPNGKLTTLQESQATNYPTDVPVKSYDFQAPLSEFGRERPVLRKLKIFDYFMRDFGASLAPMETYAPDVLPSSPADLSVPRISVRSNGSSGFLFFNNYVRERRMPERAHFQVQVKLASGSVSIPEHPITLPSGVYGIWPVRMHLRDAILRYATAQPFARVVNGKTSTIYFVTTSRVQPEFVLEEFPDVTPNPAIGTTIERRSKETIVSGMSPSLLPAFSLSGADGTRVDVIVMNQQQAEDAWKITAEEKHGMLFTSADLYEDGGKVVLQSVGDPRFHFRLEPENQIRIKPREGLRTDGPNNVLSGNIVRSTRHPVLSMRKVSDAGTVPPVRLGPKLPWRAVGVAMAPDDPAFKNAAKWDLTLPPHAWEGVNDLFLEIRYNGDVARLTSGGKLLVDNFYNGVPWEIGLKRFRHQIEAHGLQLLILPRRADAPIYLASPASPSHDATQGQILELKSVSLLPEYQVDILLSGAH